MSSSQIQFLTSEQIQSLTKEQIQSLTSQQIQSFTLAQIKSFSQEQKEVMKLILIKFEHSKNINVNFKQLISYFLQDVQDDKINSENLLVKKYNKNQFKQFDNIVQNINNLSVNNTDNGNFQEKKHSINYIVKK